MDNPAKAFIVLISLAGIMILVAYGMMTLEEHRLNTTPAISVQKGAK
jgi:hypothetical protein